MMTHHPTTHTSSLAAAYHLPPYSTATTLLLTYAAAIIHLTCVMSPPRRKVAPPCWSRDETLALIDVFRARWYCLGRGSLRAADWEAVAAAVSCRCGPASSPAKTSLQCRHKIEKLRRRYRAEKQRSLDRSGRISSSWDFFGSLHSLEGGPESSTDPNPRTLAAAGSESRCKINRSSSPNFDLDSDGDDDDDDPQNGDHVNVRGTAIPFGWNHRKNDSSYFNPNPRFDSRDFKGCSSTTVGSDYDSSANPNPRVDNFSSSSSSFKFRKYGSGGNGCGGGSAEMNPIRRVVSAIKSLGEGFVRMELMKMEVAREMEKTRMEMETKRIEMIVESQQQIVEAFVDGIVEEKKKKRKR